MALGEAAISEAAVERDFPIQGWIFRKLRVKLSEKSSESPQFNTNCLENEKRKKTDKPLLQFNELKFCTQLGKFIGRPEADKTFAGHDLDAFDTYWSRKSAVWVDLAPFAVATGVQHYWVAHSQ